jgi:uncharacterized protein YjbI with pentapeptide repeats
MAGPGTNTTDGTPYPVWGFAPPSPEPDTKKLDALLASLNASAERFQTLWFSFLGLTLYLAIAALATTHRNLLLGEPQVLPILNIKVELLPFYVIAPLLYLVFHFYLLMMLALLARTAAEFDKQLRTTLPDEPERERYRAQVGNGLFLQLLVGMKGERTGVNALLMGLIALITIVLAPLATLILMQMMFLPYHHLRITWWHRAIVVADLVLIVVMTYRCFFPRGVRKAPLVLGTLSRKPRWAAATGFCVLLAAALGPLAYWLSFQQGRWAGEPRTPSFTVWTQWMEGEPPPFPEVLPDYAPTANGIVFRLFPDRLQLSHQTIIGKEGLEKTKEEIASRGGAFVPTLNLDMRDLQAAVFSGADLRGVALQGAVMVGANFQAARLDGAHLTAAQLQGADLSGAQLQGTQLLHAWLQGADLLGARLDGADLTAARLQGADLLGARLPGANLNSAAMQGASLAFAELQGADLSGAQLQGADLQSAQLQGAVLSGAELQGANLSGADLARSAFDGSFVFRTNIAVADLATMAARSVHADQVMVGGRFGTPPVPLMSAIVKVWIDDATQFAHENQKQIIVKRFDRLRQDFREYEGVPTWSGMQEAVLALDPDGSKHRERLAAILGDLACGADDAPDVARALINATTTVVDEAARSRLSALGDQFEGVRTRMKTGREKPDVCRGVAGFTEKDWHRLEAIKPR